MSFSGENKRCLKYDDMKGYNSYEVHG